MRAARADACNIRETFPIVARGRGYQTGTMVNLWTFGGLSVRELVLRTWRESWDDAVFGQAARLAFYHFLAIFPSMLLFCFLLVKFPQIGAMRTTLAHSLGGLFPTEAAKLIQTMLERLNQTAVAGAGVLTAGLGAAWAAINGTWALMTGLNTAYEVKEQRPLWKEVGVAFLLTAAVAVMLLAALAVITYATRLFVFRWVQWPVIAVLLLAAFALFYRFGPNLSDREWQWSTPGAVLGLILWLIAAALVRLYFDRIHTYHVVYGPLEAVAMLLLWLYFTSAAILIGGELNSEIEKATEQKNGANGKSRPNREGR